MVRPVLILSAGALLFGVVQGSPTDERLRLLSADLLENITVDGQVVQILTGNVRFRKGEMELSTRRAVFYRGEERTHLSGDVVMVRPGERLTCDSLVFYSSEDRFQAWGGVHFEQEDQTITSREFTYWTELDSGIARREVVMTQETRRLTTDEFHYQKTEGPRGASFRALGDVVIDEEDRRVSGERMTYHDLIGTLDLEGEAAVEESDRDLRGGRIQLFYMGDTLRQGLVEKGAEATALIRARLSPDRQDWRVFTDVLTSRHMQADFVDDRLATLRLIGMASSTYHVVDDSVLQGVNNTTGDTLTMDFDQEDRLSRIQVRGGARGRFEPEQGNTEVDSTVIYKAEYIDYDIPGETTYLERGARVDYKENGLAAGFILMTWQNNLMRAQVAFDEQPTLHQQGQDPMYGQLMEFDMVKETGRVVKGRTQLENSYYHGELIHRHPGNVYYVRRSLYTSCELDRPHFYFAAQRMKMLTGDKVIAKPIILYLMDVPLLGLPFIVFPNETGGRRSGWLMPSYGRDSRFGRYLKGLGYYWAISDYADFETLLDFFDTGGIRASGHLVYRKRYKYNGNLNASLFRHLLGSEKDISNLFTEKAGNQWTASWRHSQTVDPTQHLNVNASYTSSPQLYKNYGLDLATRLKQQIISSAGYSKRWPGTSNQLSLSLQEKYNLQAAGQLDTPPSQTGQRPIEEKSRTLPSLRFTHGRGSFFKPGKGQVPRWYHNLYWSFNSSLNNRQSVFWEAYADTADSLVWPEVENRTVLNRAQAKNNLSLQAQTSLFQYITLNFSLGVVQDWTPSYRVALVNDTTGTFLRDEGNKSILYREVDALAARHTGQVSLSSQTTLYGLFPIRIGTLEAIRHVIKPSLSYSYRPDFSRELLGFDWGYFQRSRQGELFDRFYGSPIGSTPDRESQSLNISVSNVFQAKQLVDGKEVKTQLLSWNMSTGYDFTADSLKLRPIRSSFRSPFLRQLNLDISMVHDFYELDPITQRPVNKLRTVPRLSRMQARTQFRMTGKRFIPLAEEEGEEEGVSADTLEAEDEDKETEERIYLKRRIVKPSIAPGNLWEATFLLHYTLTPSLDPTRRETFWVNGNFKLNIGPGWKVGYTARFDALTQELINHSLQLYRQLHCWEFAFNWTPSGWGRGFLVRINVMDADLRDIKYENRGGRQSGPFSNLF